MKLVSIAALVAALIAANGITLASDVSVGADPACSLDVTQAVHPSWYRDGGYCKLPVTEANSYVKPEADDA